MNAFIDYIEKSCKSLADNRMTFLYKRSTLDRMNERADEVSRSGLKDEAVIRDLIIDEFGDLVEAYPLFVKEQKRKNRAHFMKYAFPIGGLIFLVLIFACYFTVSDLTGAWDKSWLIIVGGIFLMIIFYLSFAIKKLCTMRRVFHPVARVIIAGCVMLFTVFVFLFSLMMSEDRIITWPILPSGVALALLCDLIFAYVTGQKFRTISFFVYMPAVAAMLYIVLAAYGVVTWAGGWPVVFAGLAADLIYIVAVLAYNMKYFMYRQEVEE